MPEQALWTPTAEDLSHFNEYTGTKRGNVRGKILFRKGRNVNVSFIMSGRAPLESLEPVQMYVRLRSEVVSTDGVSIRRVVSVYPCDLAVPSGLHNLTTAQLLSPITLREAWLASRGPWPVERKRGRVIEAVTPTECGDDFESCSRSGMSSRTLREIEPGSTVKGAPGTNSRSSVVEKVVDADKWNEPFYSEELSDKMKTFIRANIVPDWKLSLAIDTASVRSSKSAPWSQTSRAGGSGK